MFEDKRFKEAKDIYDELWEFEDSENMAVLCQNNIDYLQAKAYFEEKDYEAANELFERIPGFEDSSDMIFYCDCMIRYNEALEDIDKGSFSDATKALEKIKEDVLGTSLDFSEILPLEELNYSIGNSYFGDETVIILRIMHSRLLEDIKTLRQCWTNVFRLLILMRHI